METDVAAPARRGPRPWLLILLGVVAAVFVALELWPSATPPAPASNTRATTQVKRQPVDPASLDVRLEALQDKRPGPGEAERNLFRFAPKPERPLPPEPNTGGGRGGTEPEAITPEPAPPAGPPPIPLKFIGVVEKPGSAKMAAFSDCRMTYYGFEGQIVAGQYRLVKIGVESVVMEYADGQGRTTIRQSGQECVGK
jgi:hypothetical protein